MTDADQLAQIYTDYVFAETMNAPYPFKWFYDDAEGIESYHTATFRTSTGNGYVVEFNADVVGDNTHLDVAFSQTWGNNKLFLQRKDGVTGAGDPFRVFATVGNILAQWIEKNGVPDSIGFAASPRTQSRSRLYKRFALQLAHRYNMNLEMDGSIDTGIDFILIKTDPSMATS